VQKSFPTHASLEWTGGALERRSGIWTWWGRVQQLPPECPRINNAETFLGKNSPQTRVPFRQHVMADWYTKTVLTIIAVCLLLLAGREVAAPSRNFELSRIISGLDEVSRSIHPLYSKSEGVQKVAICDVWSDNNNNCVVLRSKTSPNGPVLPILPVESEPRVNVVR
jgi:hypothetical protein